MLRKFKIGHLLACFLFLMNSALFWFAFHSIRKYGFTGIAIFVAVMAVLGAVINIVTVKVINGR